MMDKAGGPQAMMKNGAKFLMAVAVNKVFTAEPNETVTPPTETVVADASAEVSTTPAATDGALAECAELQRAREKAEELNAELQEKVVAWWEGIPIYCFELYSIIRTACIRVNSKWNSIPFCALSRSKDGSAAIYTL